MPIEALFDRPLWGDDDGVALDADDELADVVVDMMALLVLDCVTAAVPLDAVLLADAVDMVTGTVISAVTRLPNNIVWTTKLGSAVRLVVDDMT
jgi:hypothetical protein